MNARARELQVRVEALIARELAGCERCMTPEEWREHREWVTENVVESARDWMRDKAERGEL